MKTEAEIRQWRIELKDEMTSFPVITGIAPLMADGNRNSIQTLDWVLGDTPEADLIRIGILVGELLGPDETNAWLMRPNGELLGSVTPLKYIASGNADRLLPLVAALALIEEDRPE